MDRPLLWIRENPQLAGITFFLTVTIVLLAFFATLMTRSGVSLRPLIWFAGFLAIVAGPQAVVHLLDGLAIRRATSAGAPNRAATPSTPAQNAPTLEAVSWTSVFGPKADPTLITDAKHGLGAILGDATEAKLSFNVDGETALAARFATIERAQQALNAYGTFFTFGQARGSDGTGWTARRHGGQGEWVHVVTAGPELYAWTSASRESVLANRARALGAISESEFVDLSKPNPALVSTRLRGRVGFMVGLVSINLLVAGLWFFKGSAWSARIDAPAGISPASAETLRRTLLTINQTDVPTQVSVRADGAVQIDWRYADARWFDLMRVHQLKRTQRLVLILDEASRTVRVREYWSAFDASAGMEGLRLAWKTQIGIQFFHFEHKRVIGVQLAPNGTPGGDLSQAYTFNLQTLKGPIIDRVSGAGWRWQPLTWNAPHSLRWLTE